MRNRLNIEWLWKCLLPHTPSVQAYAIEHLEKLDPIWDLVRLRVNPRKARVGVRKTPDGYTVTISSLLGPGYVERHHKVPRSAILRALYAAEKANIPGIDLGLGWTYHHPQLPKPEPLPPSCECGAFLPTGWDKCPTCEAQEAFGCV